MNEKTGQKRKKGPKVVYFLGARGRNREGKNLCRWGGIQKRKDVATSPSSQLSRSKGSVERLPPEKEKGVVKKGKKKSIIS